ncbi:hypothetical protein I6B53_08515 [Schaalia sp. 19OD2882]|uniref:hypothetical protein n=1 Tax=Schaalia sp. 19OD2882 TaxID=2794089 RepID=UPI001C1EA536|nr:hypothetical protein [Schaalia sp. 19OD2882]QWW19143.1 hypothetical protein I6B53_08515 [Schaalia sp. 19OD2882]
MEKVLNVSDPIAVLAQLHSNLLLLETLREINSLQEGIIAIAGEFHRGRMALAEAAWVNLLRARAIAGSRLREQALLDLAMRAEEDLMKLEREFEHLQELLHRSSKTNFLGRFFESDSSDPDTKAKYALESIQGIIRMSEVQAVTYSVLDQPDATKQCLEELGGFLARCLPDRDALLEIAQHTSKDQGDLVDRLCLVLSGYPGCA